jgi:hypothetical protein
MTGASWTLVSNSGREKVTWFARRRERGDDAVLTCDILLEGQFFGDALGSGRPDPPPDFGLEIRGLAIRLSTLQRLHEHLQRWLELPLAEMRTSRLELDCDMGGLFDQHVHLILGDRADILASGHPVATVKYLVGRMSGELSFLTDPSGLASLCEDLAATINPAARG